MKREVLGTNVALKSNNGHFVKNAKVVQLDEVEESFSVEVDEGETATLETENHGTVTFKEDVTIFHQDALNPFTNMVSKRLD